MTKPEEQPASVRVASQANSPTVTGALPAGTLQTATPSDSATTKPNAQPDTASGETEFSNIPLSPAGEKRTRSDQFVIVGYTTNAEGVIRSILIAEAGDRIRRYAGRIHLEQIGQDVVTALQRSLDKHLTPNPTLRVGYRARWVKPNIKAEIAYVDRSRQGIIRDGYLMNFEDLQLAKPHRGQDDPTP